MPHYSSIIHVIKYLTFLFIWDFTFYIQNVVSSSSILLMNYSWIQFKILFMNSSLEPAADIEGRLTLSLFAAVTILAEWTVQWTVSRDTTMAASRSAVPCSQSGMWHLIFGNVYNESESTHVGAWCGWDCEHKTKWCLFVLTIYTAIWKRSNPYLKLTWINKYALFPFWLRLSPY